VNEIYVVHTQTRTYRNGKEPYPPLHESCRRQWLEESSSHGISVVDADVTFSTEEGTWSTVTSDSSWISHTLLAVFFCARQGLSALHLSEKRLCHVL